MHVMGGQENFAMFAVRLNAFEIFQNFLKNKKDKVHNLLVFRKL